MRKNRIFLKFSNPYDVTVTVVTKKQKADMQFRDTYIFFKQSLSKIQS